MNFKEILGKKGQVSIEYIAVMSFAVIMVTSLVITFYMQYQNMDDSVNMKQAHQIVRKIADTAESIYYLGEPSKTVLKLSMPGNVEEVIIREYEVVIKIETKAGINEIYAISKVNMTGNISTSAGMKEITIEAYQNSVNITES